MPKKVESPVRKGRIFCSILTYIWSKHKYITVSRQIVITKVCETLVLMFALTDGLIQVFSCGDVATSYTDRTV